ncbi:hypothetical protein F4810DRAFT_722462 [Camillea tinctor]|nr:hypothetical protein F4810DRAFT_722462 [Camillea tinctor]
MCLILHTMHYQCGHEMMENPKRGGPCLFQGAKQACNEAGLVRNLHFDENTVCLICQAVLNPGKEKNPVDCIVELLRENYDKDQNAKKLAARAISPKSLPPIRIAELNKILYQNLHLYIQRNANSMSSEQFARQLRYIASLPAFLDRMSLVEGLSPGFCVFLPEAKLKTLQTCAAMLENTEMLAESMVWESHAPEHPETEDTNGL